jgi:prevent-host-death family protein
MKEVSLVEFRKNAESIIGRVTRGERLVLTRRGRPAVRLEPISESSGGSDDPIYHLSDGVSTQGKSLSNRDMDRAIYGV